MENKRKVKKKIKKFSLRFKILHKVEGGVVEARHIFKIKKNKRRRINTCHIVSN